MMDNYTTAGPAMLDMIDVLGVNVCAEDIAKQYDYSTLLLAARRGLLRTELAEDIGLGNKVDERSINHRQYVDFFIVEETAKELYAAFDRNGMIRHDFSKYAVSFNILSFLKIVSNGIIEPDESYFDVVANTQRILSVLTNSEYESFEGLEPEVIEGFYRLLKWNLSATHYELITYRMGLESGYPKSRQEVANMLGLTEQAILFGEREVFAKMGRLFYDRDKAHTALTLVNREPNRIKKKQKNS